MLERNRIQRLYRLLDDLSIPYTGDEDTKVFTLDDKQVVSRRKVNPNSWDCMERPVYEYTLTDTSGTTHIKYHDSIPMLLRKYEDDMGLNSSPFEEKPLYYAVLNENTLGLLFQSKTGDKKLAVLHASVLKGATYHGLSGAIFINLQQEQDGSLRRATRDDFDEYRVVVPPDFDELNPEKVAADGLLVGNSHEDGGIKIKTPEGLIEAEGGEVIINKRSMQSEEIVSCTGTPKQIASKINELEGGVSFDAGGTCKVVSTGDTIASSSAENEPGKAENGTEVGIWKTSGPKNITITSVLDESISFDMSKEELKNFIIEQAGFYNGDERKQLDDLGYTMTVNNVTDSGEYEQHDIAADGTIIRSSDAKVRPSPAISATIFDVGTRMTGNDGFTWEIIEDSRGVRRWKRLKMEDGGDISSPVVSKTKLCFIIDKSKASSQWVWLAPGGLHVDFTIQYEKGTGTQAIPKYDYVKEQAVFEDYDYATERPYDYSFGEITDDEGTPVELPEDIIDFLRKSVAKIYDYYFKEEERDDVPDTIYVNQDTNTPIFKNGGAITQFQSEINSAVDKLYNYMAANDNKITVHGSTYNYQSKTSLYIRVIGDRGASYLVVPFFPQNQLYLKEGASYYSLSRAKVKHDFYISDTNTVVDIAADGISVKSLENLESQPESLAKDGKFIVKGLEPIRGMGSLQAELELLRDDLKAQEISMQEYYEKRSELYQKYGIAKAKNGVSVPSPKETGDTSSDKYPY